MGTDSFVPYFINGFAANVLIFPCFTRVAHFRQSCFVISMDCQWSSRRTLVFLLFSPFTLLFMDYTLSVQFFELVKLYFISYNGMKVFHIACVTDFVQKVFIWKCNQFIALNVATKVFICKCWILTIKQIKVDWCKVWVFIYCCFSWDGSNTRTANNR